MAPNPRRDTTAGRVFNDLRNIARRERRLTDDLSTRHVQEGFLRRLSRSAHRDRFVLKGGLLLSVLDARRPTRDADLLGRGINGDEDIVLSAVLEIAGTAISMGSGSRPTLAEHRPSATMTNTAVSESSSRPALHRPPSGSSST